MKDLKRILRRAGHFYESPQFLFHKLLRNEFIEMGFRVISIERLEAHPVWHVRLRGTANAQNYLLLSQPLAKRFRDVDDETDLMPAQLKAEVQRIASALGPPIKSDYLTVMRAGIFFTLAFIWPVGSTGLLLRQQPRPDAFRLLIRPWLKTQRN